MTMVVKKVDTKKDYAFCIYIRTLVFAIGQDCPLPQEFNDREDGAIDYVGLLDDEPVATARYRIVDNHIGKIERVAVLDTYQGRGLGKQIVQHLIDDIKKNPEIECIKLGAQNYAIPFYESLGLNVYGDEYMEAGIPHHNMSMEV